MSSSRPDAVRASSAHDLHAPAASPSRLCWTPTPNPKAPVEIRITSGLWCPQTEETAWERRTFQNLSAFLTPAVKPEEGQVSRSLTFLSTEARTTVSSTSGERSLICISHISMQTLPCRDVPGGPGVKTLHFQCKGRRFDLQVRSAGQGAEIPYAKQPKKKRKTQQRKTNKPPLQTQPTHGGLSLWAPELSLTSKSRDSFLGPTTGWQEVISAAQRTPGHWARDCFDPKWSPEGAATVGLLEERTSLALELTALDREAYLSPLSCNFLSPVCVLDSLPACLSACPVHCHKNTQNRLSAKFLDFGDKWWIRLRFFPKRACHLTGKSSTWYFYRVVYGDLGVYKVTQKRQGALGFLPEHLRRLPGGGDIWSEFRK